MKKHFHIQLTENSKILVLAFSQVEEGEVGDYFEILKKLPNCSVIIVGDQVGSVVDGIEGMGTFSQSVASIFDFAKSNDLEDIVVIGQGLGTAAAVKYGTALLARILCFSAIYLTESQQFPEHHFDAREYLDIGKQDLTLITGEKNDEDLLAAHAIYLHCECKRYSIRYAGVDVAKFLALKYLFFPMVRQYIDKKPMHRIVAFSAAYKSIKFAEYYTKHVNQQKNGDYYAAAVTGERALTEYPCAIDVHSNLAKLYTGQKDYTSALPNLAFLSAIAPTSVVAAFNFATAVKRTGSIDLALYLHRINHSKWPDHALTVFDIGLCLLFLKDNEAAYKYLLMAHELEPENKSFKKKLESVSPKIK